MKHSILHTLLLALCLWMIAGLSLAADPQLRAGSQANASPSQAAVAQAGKGGKAAAPQPVPIDINSASRKELKELPGIGDAEADRIIAGRPYLSKAHLQTHNIVSPLVYQGLRERVVARQKDAKFAKASNK